MTPQHDLTGPKIPFERLTPDELNLCVEIGKRAAALARHFAATRKNVQLEIDSMQCAMDIAVAHLSRPLDLLRFLRADDLSFFNDFVTIELNINRLDGTLPNFVHLQHAANVAAN